MKSEKKELEGAIIVFKNTFFSGDSNAFPTYIDLLLKQTKSFMDRLISSALLDGISTISRFLEKNMQIQLTKVMRIFYHGNFKDILAGISNHVCQTDWDIRDDFLGYLLHIMRQRINKITDLILFDPKKICDGLCSDILHNKLSSEDLKPAVRYWIANFYLYYFSEGQLGLEDSNIVSAQFQYYFRSLDALYDWTNSLPSWMYEDPKDEA